MKDVKQKEKNELLGCNVMSTRNTSFELDFKPTFTGSFSFLLGLCELKLVIMTLRGSIPK